MGFINVETCPCHILALSYVSYVPYVSYADINWLTLVSSRSFLWCCACSNFTLWFSFVCNFGLVSCFQEIGLLFIFSDFQRCYLLRLFCLPHLLLSTLGDHNIEPRIDLGHNISTFLIRPFPSQAFPASELVVQVPPLVAQLLHRVVVRQASSTVELEEELPADASDGDGGGGDGDHRHVSGGWLILSM